MINFQVSAPGKLNLFGEDSTCDDHNGVMTSIDQRNTIKFKELEHSKGIIQLDYPKIQLYSIICLRKFKNFYKRCIFDETLFEQIQRFCYFGMLIHDGQKKIGESLLYLLAYVTYKEEIDIENLTSFQMYVDAKLPCVTFGGIASIVVCFTTCFLYWSYMRKGDYHELNDFDRRKIAMYSKSCEKIFNYCMFKSDVTVSTYGSMLRYRCNDTWQNDVLDNMPRMTVLLVDSTVNLDKEVATKMKKYFKNHNPHMENSILDNITVVSDTAFSIFKEIRDMDKEAATYMQDVSAQEKTLLPLIRIQHQLNNIFIDFSIQMNRICTIAQRYKLSGKCADFDSAKYAYIWCPPSGRNIQGTSIELMIHDLRSNGFYVKIIDLNCDGVKIE